MARRRDMTKILEGEECNVPCRTAGMPIVRPIFTEEIYFSVFSFLDDLCVRVGQKTASVHSGKCVLHALPDVAFLQAMART